MLYITDKGETIYKMHEYEEPDCHFKLQCVTGHGQIKLWYVSEWKHQRTNQEMV